MTRLKRMLSKWAIPPIALIVTLIVPLGAHALGLGEARVESFLNQPLDVRMRLLDVSDDDLDSLTVTPASPEDFERLGLMSNSLALGIQIEVDRSVSPPVVRVTSASAVSDPVVQLLLDARWGSGRMLREYTLFLDPPTTAVEPPAPAPAQPVQQREPTAERDAADSEAAASARPAEATRPQQARPVANSGTRRYGPVASGDTLWSIARANLPVGVTMNQMMIAIVELNPNAFREGNINQLLSGAELQLPDGEQVRGPDPATAAAEVAAQHRAFRRLMTSDVPVVSPAGRDASSPDTESSVPRDMDDSPAEAASEDPADHRLSLVPPGDEESGTGLSEDAAEVAELRQRLARAEEELYAARQEAEEFQSRVEDLETAIRQNPGGIGLRDAELANLEATLRAAREATRDDADPQLRAEVSERLESYLDQYEAAAQDSDSGEQVASSESGSARGDDGSIEAQEGARQAQEDAQRNAAGTSLPSEEMSEADAISASDDSTPASDRETAESQSSRGLLSNPLLLISMGLVLLLLGLAIAWLALRRRREQTEAGSPLKRGTEVPPGSRPAEDPIQVARAHVSENPDNLAAHLALLQTLATDGRQDEFGEALELMYVHVDSDSQAEWREALDLAARVVPGHSLVKGSSDWVAESSDRDVDEPASEVDEDSEVGDLMTRLDEDMDESDDREWLGEETADTSKTDAPLLRGDEDPEGGHDPDRAPGDDESVSALDEVDEDIDFGGWGEDQEISGDKSESGVQASSPEEESAAEKDGEVTLDWPDEEDSASEGEFEAEPADDESTSDDTVSDEATGLEFGEADEGGADQEQADDDIFAQSDDDIDVKLDLAKAYLSWNSVDSARTLLEEVAREGNESQREEADKLLNDLSDDSGD